MTQQQEGEGKSGGTTWLIRRDTYPRDEESRIGVPLSCMPPALLSQSCHLPQTAPQQPTPSEHLTVIEPKLSEPSDFFAPLNGRRETKVREGAVADDA